MFVNSALVHRLVLAFFLRFLYEHIGDQTNTSGQHVTNEQLRE